MRTASPGIVSAEQASVVAPRYRVIAADEVPHMYAVTSYSTADLDTSIPQDIISDGIYIYGSWVGSSGTKHVKYIDPTTTSNFRLDNSTLQFGDFSTVNCLRHQICVDQEVPYLWDAVNTGSAVQLRRRQLNPAMNLSFANFGPTVPVTLSSSSSLVVRVETICPTTDCCIVVIGTHDATRGISQMMYWLVTISSAKRLLINVEDYNTLGSYPSWHGFGKNWTHCSASGSYANMAFMFNTLTSGRSEIINIKNGVCSTRRGVIDTDIEQTTHVFLGTKITPISGRWLMTGRFTTIDTDGNVVGYDGYAVSSDLEVWSVAARETYLAYSQLRGGIACRYSTNNPGVWYVGSNVINYSSGNVYLNSIYSGAQTDITDYVIELSLDQITNGADTLEMTLRNPIQVDGQGLFDTHGRVTRGGLVRIEMGFGGDWVVMGIYNIDDLQRTVTADGMSAMAVRAREQAGKKMADVHMPTDIQITGRAVKRFDLTNDSLEGVQPKTKDTQYTVGKNGLTFTGLNSPNIFLLDVPDRDGWIIARIKSTVQNSYHIGTFSFLFDVIEDDQGHATGYVASIPKQHNWTGHIHDKCEIRKLNLPAINATDSEAMQTGYNLTPRINTVLENVGTGGQQITAAAGTPTYITQNAVPTGFNGFAADNECELAFGKRGAVVSVYYREMNLDTYTISDSSQWQLLSEVFLDANEFYEPPKKRQFGIMLNHDVWVDTGSLDQTEVGDMELSLTNAQNVTGDSSIYAYAFSGAVPVNDAGAIVKTFDPGAIKLNLLVAGRGAIVSNTNTAFFTRFIESDGVRHNFMDANYPTVNPIPVGSSGSYGSEPESWRMLLHHGRINSDAMTGFGLPNGNSDKRYVLIDDEIIRYRTETFTRPNSTTATWTVVPCYYSVLAAMGKDSTTLTGWSSGGGSPSYPGDAFDAIPDLQGLLVEFTARNFDDTKDGDIRFYATGSYTAGPPATMQLDKAYPGQLAAAEALAIISGRAQFNTKKEQHDNGAPCLFAPVNSSGQLPSLSLLRLAYYGGAYASVEDILRRCCAYAGVAFTSFRPNFANAAVNTWKSLTVTTTPQAFDLRETVSDFVLDLVVHIPGNVVGTGATERKLYIDFRNFYRIVLQQRPTVTDCSTGQVGVLCVGLQNTSGAIGAGSDGFRWLGRIPVRMTNESLSGAVTGSGGNWSTSEDMDLRQKVRIAVVGDVITIDLNGSNVFTFDLQSLKNDTFDWIRNTESTVSISSSVSIGSWLCDYWLSDLDDSVEDFVVEQNGSMRASIDSLMANRHIWSRTADTSGWDSGIHFDRYWIRDDLGEMKQNMISEERSYHDDKLVGHVRVTGTECQADALDYTVLQNYGYKFELISNPVLQTARHCRDEARLWLREQAETQTTWAFNGLARLEAQPGDKGTFGYAMGSFRPFMSDTVCTIVAHQIRATISSCRSSFDVRRFVTI